MQNEKDEVLKITIKHFLAFETKDDIDEIHNLVNYLIYKSSVNSRSLEKEENLNYEENIDYLTTILSFMRDGIRTKFIKVNENDNIFVTCVCIISNLVVDGKNDMANDFCKIITNAHKLADNDKLEKILEKNNQNNNLELKTIKRINANFGKH